MAVEKSKEQQEAEVDDGTISLEDIDDIINESDPEFNKSLEAIQEDDELNSAEIDPSEGTDVPLEDDVKSHVEKLIQRFPQLKKLVRLGQWLSIFFKRRYQRIKISFGDIVARAVIYLKTELPDRIKYHSSRSKEYLAALVGGVKALRQISLKKKLALVGVVALLGLISFQIKMIAGGGWLPEISEGLVGDFAEVADQVYEFDRPADLQEYYRAFPQEQFEVLFEKFVVNLRRARANQTPMATFAIYLNVDSQDTAIEVKDREKEFTDIISRVVEDYSFKEISALEGKRRMKTQVRKELNDVLNQGRVEKVYLKHLIAKP